MTAFLHSARLFFKTLVAVLGIVLLTELLATAADHYVGVTLDRLTLAVLLAVMSRRDIDAWLV